MKLKLEKADQSSSSEEESDHNMSENEMQNSQAPQDVKEMSEIEEKNDEAKPVNISNCKVMASDSETNHAIQSETFLTYENVENVDANVPSNVNSSNQPAPVDNSDYSPSSNSPVFSGINVIHTHSVTIKSTMKTKSIQPVNQLFAEEEEDQSSLQLKKARIDAGTDCLIILFKLSIQLNFENYPEERKRAVKKLVESIPTDRDELFAYPIDWSHLDQSLMDKRIKPWINKKIIEYIGEEEATLNDFICSKIEQHVKPEKLLEEVKVVLDEEAELFVKKMWRLIVYETESKRCGLSK
jgi:RNA-binding protein 25